MFSCLISSLIYFLPLFGRHSSAFANCRFARVAVVGTVPTRKYVFLCVFSCRNSCKRVGSATQRLGAC